MFWLISIAVLLAAGVVVLWPLLARESGWKMLALALILALPLASYWLYQGVGTPQGLNQTLSLATHPATGEAPGGNQLDELAERLRGRLQERPEDVQGWVLLGRSYKTLQQYPQALEALETANRLVPNQPLVLVELVEARLFASGNPEITAEMKSTLEHAVATDPGLQKGLWLLAIAAAQAGNDQAALERWEQLVQQIEPGSEIEQSVVQQINQAKTRLGLTSETAPPPVFAGTPAPKPAATPPGTNAWSGANIRVALSGSAFQGQVPDGAVLFIIVRPEGTTGGPPLGVRRIDHPQFPLEVTLTDRDSMMQQRPISSSPRLQLQARLSLTGQPTPVAGDWQSSVSSVPPEEGQLNTLILDQEVE